MKKELIIAAATILIIASPVFAVSSRSNDKSEESHGNNTRSIKLNVTADNEETITPTLTPTPSVADTKEEDVDDDVDAEADNEAEIQCDPSATWKNHGKFVSCVAKLHLGGQVTSVAARSEIGKQHGGEPSPTATPSPTPVSSGAQTLNETSSPVSNFGSIFQRFIDFFKNLL